MSLATVTNEEAIFQLDPSLIDHCQAFGNLLPVSAGYSAERGPKSAVVHDVVRVFADHPREASGRRTPGRS
jgi:hypothetical protein